MVQQGCSPAPAVHAGSRQDAAACSPCCHSGRGADRTTAIGTAGVPGGAPTTAGRAPTTEPGQGSSQKSKPRTRPPSPETWPGRPRAGSSWRSAAGHKKRGRQCPLGVAQSGARQFLAFCGTQGARAKASRGAHGRRHARAAPSSWARMLLTSRHAQAEPAGLATHARWGGGGPAQHAGCPSPTHLRVRHAVLVQHKDVEPIVLGDVGRVSGARPAGSIHQRRTRGSAQAWGPAMHGRRRGVGG